MGRYLRIGEVAQRTRTSPELLRAWERRYGLLSPGRSSGGFRLYEDADVDRVRRMVGAVRTGIAPAEAARLVLAEQSAGQQVPTKLDGADLLAAVLAFDDAGANSVVDRLLSCYGLETVVGEAVLPALRELGDGWARGDVTVAQEHFASNLLRARLVGLGRDWDRGVGPMAVLAALPGELHDIPLVALGLGLRNRGWRVTFLGADTPVDTLRDTAVRTGADLTVACAVVAGAVERSLTELEGLAPADRPVLAGPGVSVRLAARLGVRCVNRHPFEAAELLTSTRGVKPGGRDWPAHPIT